MPRLIEKLHVEERLSAVLDSIAGIHWWKDINGVYRGCNQAMAEALKLSSKYDIIGKTDYELPWSNQADILVENDRIVLETGITQRGKEEPVTTNDGEYHIFMVAKAPLYNADGKIIRTVGNSIDITEQKRLEKNIKIQKQKAELASQSKSEFIANMSHDLRTPITGMLGMIQDMLNTADQAQSSLHPNETSHSASELKNVIETVQRDGHFLMCATDELLQLCNEILEIVRLESGQSDNPSESFNLRDILEHNIELLRPAAQHKKLQLSYEINPNVPTYLQGSCIYLDRILLNLMSNALKFTKKGRVKVSIKALNQHGISRKIGEDINIEIVVEDTGIGIPKDKFDIIFEHFSRLTPSHDGLYKGAGLGLYTVKRYVKAMQGNIRVDSKLGQGTHFTVTLPFVVSDHSDRVKQSFRFSRPVDTISDVTQDRDATASVSVLVVEDHPLAAIAVKLALEPFNCHIDIAENGAMAVAMAQKGHYDLILMDVGLPDFSGIEATKKIRALSNSSKSRVPIVALTGHANNPEMRQEALDAGMQEVLSKPAQPLALESILQDYVFKVETRKPSVHQSTPANEPPSCVAIDWDACIRMCNGDPKFTREMLSMLADDLHRTKAALAKAFANRDIQALRDELHRSRGGACYLKVPQLEQTLKAFHQAVKAEPLDEKAFATTYKALQDAIRIFWDTWESDNVHQN